ncbi:MAG: NAD(P)-binding domain-containing protein [Acidimicrobiales bacterium]|nr:NAD(P)-binding domain-containing protein [Acidimicrobiales bacterium]
MPTVAVIGSGVVGRRVARQLAASGLVDRLILGARRPQRMHGFVRQLIDVDIEVIAPGPLPAADVTVLAQPCGGHTELAEEAIGNGSHVVSLSDALNDVEGLLDLDSTADKADRSVIVGAAFSPGLSCLLARHGASRFDRVEEVHVARMGTGGPSCQRQLHRARTQEALERRNGSWMKRPSGAGRELIWFPDPLGARDCYRAALADPVLLSASFPEAERITAKVAATRRDRLTAWLPMLRPPHRDGGPGAVRVEIRGVRDEVQTTEVIGAIDYPSSAASAVAAIAAEWSLLDVLPSGSWSLGMLDDPLPWLQELENRGITAAVYEGLSTT